MTKNLKILLLLLFIFQVLIAANFGLAHDEAYYWLFSHNLDWGYFDHPPMVAIVIKLFSFLPHSELSVRLGFILSQFAALYFLLKLLKPQDQFTATLLYFAFPLASFSGLLALPDMPLLFMTAIYCYFLHLYLKRPNVSVAIALGLAIAFLLYSKYHGILLVFFTILALPKLFKEKYFYLVAAVAIAFFLPHVWWQYRHEFVTLRYHFLERPSSSFSLARIGEYLGLQLVLAGVFVSPLLWWGILKKRSENDFQRAMKFIVIGTTLFFLISTSSKKFEANWTVFLAISLIYLSAQTDIFKSRIFTRLTLASFALVVVLRILFVLPADTVSIRRLKEFQGWNEFAQNIKEKCQSPVLANTYQMASRLSFYLQEPVHALNFHSRKNQFDLWIPDETYYLSPKLCYVTDKKQFEGEIIESPEGKSLRVVRDFSPTELK